MVGTMAGDITLDQIRCSQEFDLLNQIENSDDTNLNASANIQQCNYYGPLEFMNNITNHVTDFSLFSLNCRSLAANYEKLKLKLQEVEEHDRLKNWQPPIDGQLIMDTFKIPPGRTIGIIKSEIREAILDGAIPNEYDSAYELMLEIGQRLKLEKNNI